MPRREGVRTAHTNIHVLWLSCAPDVQTLVVRVGAVAIDAASIGIERRWRRGYASAVISARERRVGLVDWSVWRRYVEHAWTVHPTERAVSGDRPGQGAVETVGVVSGETSCGALGSHRHHARSGW